jgi:hypothetical protein
MEPTAPATATWREYVSAIIAVIALIQPWLLWGWRKFFRRGSIEIFNTSTIEVGYSNLGPTLGLQGTLRGHDREQFIRGITVEVIREADKRPAPL